jgi:hypothetical protein
MLLQKRMRTQQECLERIRRANLNALRSLENEVIEAGVSALPRGCYEAPTESLQVRNRLAARLCDRLEMPGVGAPSSGISAENDVADTAVCCLRPGNLARRIGS